MEKTTPSLSLGDSKGFIESHSVNDETVMVDIALDIDVRKKEFEKLKVVLGGEKGVSKFVSWLLNEDLKEMFQEGEKDYLDWITSKFSVLRKTV